MHQFEKHFFGTFFTHVLSPSLLNDKWVRACSRHINRRSAILTEKRVRKNKANLHSPTLSTKNNSEIFSATQNTIEGNQEASNGQPRSPDSGASSQSEGFFDHYDDLPLKENQFFKEELEADCIDESVAMDLDYDHLMAYFDGLKESNA